MKAQSALALALSVLVHGSTVSAKSSFGPKNCATISRSIKGSCVITTDCEGSDLSQTEFAFDCIGSSGIVRHSFGKGGFDSSEEFDSEVQCDRCESVRVQAPAPVKAAPKKSVPKVSKPEVPVKAAVVLKAKRRQNVKVAAATQHHAKAQAKAKFWPFTSPAEKKPEVARYGPNGCVSTWRSEEGHCIMATDCKKEKIAKYEFGLVCVDKTGAPVRHLFGKDSFDEEETFDTLIKCDKCLGLEDIPDAVALNGEVMSMSKDIANLKDVMKNISINVQMLNSEVFKPASPGPAPAPAAAEPVAFVRSDEVETVKTHNLRHTQKSQKHMETRDSYYDDEDDYTRDGKEERGSDVQEAVLSDDKVEDWNNEEDED